MDLAALAVGQLAADVQGIAIVQRVRIGDVVAAHGFLRHLGQADAIDGAACTGEVALEKARRQAHGIEDLGAAIGLVGRDAHLRHDLQDALVDGPDVAPLHFFLGQFLGQRRPQRQQRVEGEIRVYGLGAIARQQAEIVHPPGLAGFHNQADFGAQAPADQVVVDARRGQQRGDGDVVGVDRAVRQYQDVVASIDHLLGALEQPLQRRLHAVGVVAGGIGDVQGVSAEGVVDVVLDAADALQVHVGEDGLAHLEALFGAGVVGVQKVRPGPDQRHQRHHQFFADGVDGRVGDLGEALLEIVEKVLGAVRQDGQRRVGAH